MNWLRAPLIGREIAPPLWLLVMLTGCGTLSLHILVPALPSAARDLGVSGGTIQLVVTLYLVGLAGGQLVYGALSDRFGRRPVLVVGVALYVGAGFVAAAAPGILLLLVARVAQSLGGCAGLVLGRAIIRDVAPPREAAARLALVNLVMSVSPALAPLIGAYITVLMGWRVIFVLLGLIGGVALVASVVILPETHRGGGRAGFGAMLRSYAHLATMPSFRGYAAAGAMGTTCFYAFMSASPFIFGDLLGRPTEEIGLYYGILFVGITLGSFVANRLVVRMGPQGLLRWALTLALVGAVFFLAAELAGRLSVATVLGAMLLFTIGIGTASPLALTLAIGTQPGAIGAASGLYGFTQMGFGALCTLVMTLDLANPALMAAGLQTASIAAALIALGMAIRAERGRLAS